ncbi:DUF6314 family protein [Streptomyces sp. NPDC046215]|uniref:DUF6314 family protein n=1 Tax=Streptomyces stramineus TaxID=173861 RepID=A0ABP3KEA8_9ACTN
MSSAAPTPPPLGTSGPHPVPDALAYLAGRWSVRRTLVDLGTGSRGTFDGTAAFRPLDGSAGLLHVEEGQLSWNGTVNRASRTLQVLPAPDGTAEVTFADGRPFHDLDLRTGRWTTRHHCGADLYLATFTVVSPDAWQVQWRTTGPAKDHLLRTTHQRCAAAGPHGESTP